METIDKIEDHSRLNYFQAFPEEELLRVAFGDAFVINQPLSTVGGDGYAFHQSEQYLYLVAFDCMGHGRFASMMTRKYLNAIGEALESKENLEPAQLLDRIHRTIEQEFVDEKKNTLQGTGADVGILKIPTETSNRCCYAGASMDLIFIEGGEIHRYRGHRRQVGEMFDLPRTYENINITYSTNTEVRCYMSSDGIRDLIGGPKNRKLMYKNLAPILLQLQGLSVNEQKRALEKKLKGWMGPNEPLDDLLMIGISL